MEQGTALETRPVRLTQLSRQLSTIGSRVPHVEDRERKRDLVKEGD